MNPPTSKLTAQFRATPTSAVEPVIIWVERGMLQIAGRTWLKQEPISSMQIASETDHEVHNGVSGIELPCGALLCAVDQTQWQAWHQTHNHQTSAGKVRKLSERWQTLAIMLLACMSALGLCSHWLLPH